MAVTTTKTNKPINPRGNDQSPKGYNRAALYSGKALDFDGVNDRVNITTDSFDLYSVSFYYIGAIGTAANGTAFSSGTTNVNDGVTLGAFTGTLTNETIAIGKDGNYTATSETFADGVHFICASWDATNSKYKIYINGQEVDTFNNGSDAGLNTGITAPALGYRKLLSDQYIEGGLSNVRAFNVALTAAQVADLYNNPEKIVPTGVADSALKLWLPMQEGAGTTAYDGSGNGNHGTISGATWTHGIGAPVAQSAVIDWNKGVNILQQSNAFSTSPWLSFVTLTSGQAGHDGTNNAWKIEKDASSEYLYQNTTITGAGVFSVYAKAGSLNWIRMLVNGSSNGFYYFDLENGVVGSGSAAIAGYIDDVGNGWYRCSFSFNLGTVSRVRIYPADGDNDISGTSGNIYIQDAQAINGSSVGPYIPTFGTAQTSDVLLPAGLTTGRDITGVNLFENVRKQGALNLDGNSWAEVHDNASLEIPNTDDVTMEIWFNRLAEPKNVYPKWIDVGLGISSETNYSVGTILKTDEVFVEWRTSSSGWIFTDTDVTFNKNEWIHLVVTIEMTGASSSIKTYKNGVLSSTKSQGTARGTGGKTIIGKHRANNYYGYDLLAQPRIYNRALTAEEVERNYNAGKNIYK